jgi:Na+-transporting NADH:ubiquinone oxidoreductase subunit NqrD
MKYIFLFILLPIMIIHSQTKIRLGDGTNSYNKVLYTIDRVKVRLGSGTYSSNKVLFTIDGNKVRQGNGTMEMHPSIMRQTKNID